MKAVTLALAVLVWTAGCASTRYEEYGPPIEEPIELPLPTTEEEPGVAEASAPPPERTERLESLLVDRLERLEATERQQAARLSALAEQVEALRAQIVELRGGGVPVQQGGAPAPATSAVDLYDEGLTHFDAERYGRARVAFRAVMDHNPRGDLADNAQYWLGECAYAEGNYTAAIEAFRRVFQYAVTEKDDDAQIKLGYCYQRLGDLDSALVEFKRLTVDYPKSEYLLRAQEQIRRIRAAKATSP